MGVGEVGNEVRDRVLFLSALVLPGFPQRLVLRGTRDEVRAASFGSELRISVLLSALQEEIPQACLLLC